MRSKTLFAGAVAAAAPVLFACEPDFVYREPSPPTATTVAPAETSSSAQDQQNSSAASPRYAVSLANLWWSGQDRCGVDQCNVFAVLETGAQRGRSYTAPDSWPTATVTWEHRQLLVATPAELATGVQIRAYNDDGMGTAICQGCRTVSDWDLNAGTVRIDCGTATASPVSCQPANETVTATFTIGLTRVY